MLVSDGVGDADRIEAIATAAAAGGLACLQLREPAWSTRQLQQCCERLRDRFDGVGALLFVNDGVELVAAGLADGAQLGRRSPSPASARSRLGERGLLGHSSHDEHELRRAAGHCDFALLSPVWPTTCKPGAPALGVARAAELTATAALPVLWLGGVEPERLAALAALPAKARPIGLAVRSAICSAADPTAATRTLLSALPTA